MKVLKDRLPFLMYIVLANDVDLEGFSLSLDPDPIFQVIPRIIPTYLTRQTNWQIFSASLLAY